MHGACLLFRRQRRLLRVVWLSKRLPPLRCTRRSVHADGGQRARGRPLDVVAALRWTAAPPRGRGRDQHHGQRPEPRSGARQGAAAPAEGARGETSYRPAGQWRQRAALVTDGGHATAVRKRTGPRARRTKRRTSRWDEDGFCCREERKHKYSAHVEALVEPTDIRDESNVYKCTI